MLIRNGVLVKVSEADIINGKFDFPEGCTSIGESAFFGCSSLTTLILPASMTLIGRGAFINCSSLTALTILGGSTEISKGVFFGCNSLTTLTFPGSVASINSRAFFNCDNVEDIFIVVKPSGSTAEEMAKNQLVQFERVAKLFPKNLQDKIKEENLVSFLVSLAASHCGNDSPQQTGQPSKGVTGALGLFSATPERKSSGESSTPEDDNTIKP